MSAFVTLLDLLADVPDPRRGQGQLHKLPHMLLFSVLAIVTGGNSYRGVEKPTQNRRFSGEQVDATNYGSCDGRERI